MANITNLSAFLTDVANAIRNKRNGAEKILAGNFDSEINNIITHKDIMVSQIEPTGEDRKNMWVKTSYNLVDPNTLGGGEFDWRGGPSSTGWKDLFTHTDFIKIEPGVTHISVVLHPSEITSHDIKMYGYDENKKYNSSLNGTTAANTQFHTFEIKNGTSYVRFVIGDYISGPPKTSRIPCVYYGDKVLPYVEYGEIETIYELVDGVYKELLNPAAKLFSSIEDMHADASAKLDDLAVVYGKKSGPANLTTVFNSVTFPRTVVLPTAVSSTLMTIFGNEAGDYCQCRLMSTSFQLYNYITPGGERITYTSSDGKTYTRTDTYGDTLELGSPCMFTEDYGWDDRFGYFMQVSSTKFEGLFQYTAFTDKNEVRLLKTDGISGSGSSITNVNIIEDNSINIQDVNDIISDIMIETGDADASHYWLSKINDKYVILFAKSVYGLMTNTTNDAFIGFIAQHVYSYSTDLNIYDIDLVNKTYTFNHTVVKSELTESKSSTSVQTCYYVDGVQTVPFSCYNMRYSYYISTFLDNASYYYFRTSYSASVTYVDKMEYKYAPNQFSLRNSNQLLEGVNALGNQGEIIGDGSIYNNLDNLAILNNWFSNMKMEEVDIWCSIADNIVQYFKLDRQGDYSFVKVKNPIKVDYTQPMTLSSDLSRAYVLTNSTTSTIYDLITGAELKTITHPSDSGDTYQKYKYAVEFGDIICYINDAGEVRKLDLITMSDSLILTIPLETNPYMQEYRFFKLNNSEILFIYGASNKSTYNITVFAKLIKIYEDDIVGVTDIINYTQVSKRNGNNIIYQYVSDEKIWIDVKYSNTNGQGWYNKMFEFDRINSSPENNIVYDRLQNNSGIMNSLNRCYVIPYNGGFFGYGTSSTYVYYYRPSNQTMANNYYFKLPDGTSISPLDVYKFFDGLAYYYNNKYWFIKNIEVSGTDVILYADDAFAFNMYKAIDGKINSIQFTIDIVYDAENKLVKSKPYKGAITALDYAEIKSITKCESNLSDYTLVGCAPYLFGSMMTYGLDGEMLMSVMEEIMPAGETFDGLGGTEEEIESVLDEILGNK